MKKITENVSHTNNSKQCKNRYHEKRTPTKIKNTIITKSNAILNNRCKISVINVCQYPNNTHKDCPLTKKR